MNTLAMFESAKLQAPPPSPLFVVTEDAIYVVRDGMLQRHDLIGEIDANFTPIPIGDQIVSD